MTVRTSFVVLALLACCGICHGKEERWSNFAEDGEVKYYLDQKSVQSLPDNVYLFWVKAIAKDKEYFRREYNLQNLSYIFTNYELDCAVSSYRVRGSIMFDKNRREISKTLLSTDGAYEPVPPESMLELAQDEICSRAQTAAKKTDSEEPVKAPSAVAKQAEPSEGVKAVSAATVVAAGRTTAQVPPLPAEPAPDEPAPGPEMVPNDPPPPPPGVVEPAVPDLPAAPEPPAPERPIPPEPVPGEPPAPAEPAAPPTFPPDRPAAEGIAPAGAIGAAVSVGAAGRF